MVCGWGGVVVRGVGVWAHQSEEESQRDGEGLCGGVGHAVLKEHTYVGLGLCTVVRVTMAAMHGSVSGSVSGSVQREWQRVACIVSGIV